jgi:cyanate lyase
MTRDELGQAVMAAKVERGLSWQELADAVSKPVAWVVAALLGEHPLHPVDAATLAAKLGLPERATPILMSPIRGRPLTAASADPAGCRAYEVLGSYRAG